MLDRKLAPLRHGLDHVVSEAIDPWENIHSEKSDVAKSLSESVLGPVSNFYGIPKRHYCMVLGTCKNADIICSHIWPKHTAGRGLNIFELPPESVSHPQNFLRLHRAIEQAFHRKRLTFIPAGSFEETTVNLEVKILDPALRSEILSFNGTNITMDSLDGKEMDIKFSADKCPYLRLLAAHALQAFKSARMNGWIIDIVDTGRRQRAYELARRSLREGHVALFSCFRSGNV